MNFASDNGWGAAPEMLEALRAANAGAEASYGEDEVTMRLTDHMSRIFEKPVAVFPVVSGTAANALALATIVPPHGAIFCHAVAHIATDECGAPGFFTHGAQIAILNGPDGKFDCETVETAMSRIAGGSVHHSQPAAISITQATECGTCYTPGEIGELAATARRHDMRLHMDGARFANAVAHLGCAPADITWKAGVDILSFGATKNGALAAESVVFFDSRHIGDFEFRRKKSGHLLSKLRFVSAQLVCALQENRWLRWAERANELALCMARELRNIPDVEIAWPVEANAVFVHLPDSMIRRLRERGATFYDWAAPAGGRTLVRLVTSFATPEAAIDEFIAIARAWAIRSVQEA